MHIPLRPPRATALQLAGYTGSLGEIFINTDSKTIHILDGLSAGGTALSKVGHSHAPSEVASWLGYVPLNAALVGQANGVAPLDADGMVPASMIPGGGSGGGGGVSDAGQLLGQTLASNVIYSSLTTLGVLSDLTVTNTISGSVDGNAGSADKLSTARTFSFTGDASGSADFDGSADANVTLTLATVNASPVMDSFSRVTTNGSGLVVATSPVTGADISGALGFTPVDQAYVDGVASNFTQRPGVRFASTDPVGGTYNNGTDGTDATLSGSGTIPAIGGGTPNLGDRVILMGETDKTRNGIFKVTQSNPWILTRDGGLTDVKNGAMVLVDEGTHAGEKWIQITANPITIGTSQLEYTLFQAAATAYTSGSGISIANNKITNTGVLAIAGSTNQINPVLSNGTVTLTLTPSVTISGTMTASSFAGSGANLTALNAANLTTGQVPVGRMGTGTANSGTVLYGDGTWKAPVAATPNNLAATATLATSLAANGVFISANGSSANVIHVNSAAASDSKVWNNFTDSFGNWIVKAQYDGNAGGSIGLMLQRTGTTITQAQINATAINLNGAVTGTSFTGDGTGLTNVASARSVVAPMIAGTAVTDLITATMATNDYFRIRVGGSAVDGGWAEIATADGGNEPIYVRQYSGSYAFTSIVNSITLLDGTGNTTFPKTVTATSFIGNGSLLTNLNAASLSTGQVPVARMGTGTANNGTVLYGDGSWKTPSVTMLQLTNGQIKSGIWAGTTSNDGYTYNGAGNGRFGFSAASGVLDIYVDGNVFVNEGTEKLLSQAGFEALTSVNGSKLTNLNAANLATGQVPVARMGTGTANSSSVLYGDGTWKSISLTTLNATGNLPLSTTANAVQVGVYGSGGIVALVSSGAGTDNKTWEMLNDTGGNFSIKPLSDSGTAGTASLNIARSGTTTTTVTFNATSMNLALGTGGLQLNGSAGTAGQVLTSNGSGAAPTWQDPTGGGGGGGGSTVLNGTDSPTRTATVTGVYAGVYASAPEMFFTNSASAANARIWSQAMDSSGNWTMRAENDGSAGNVAMQFQRSGSTVTSMAVTATAISLNGAVTATTLSANSVAVTSSTAPTNGMYLPATNTLGFATNGSVALQINASNAFGFAGANYGTAGQVLQSNGNAAAPTWVNLPGASTLNATATVSFTRTTSGVYAGLVGGPPNFLMINGNATTDQKVWANYVDNSGTWSLQPQADANGTGTAFLTVTRSANVPSAVTMNSGSLTYNGQNLGATLSGGAINITAAAGGSTSGNGGAINLNSGNAATSGSGGSIGINAGNGNGTGAGGSVTFTTGDASGTGGGGGTFTFTCGTSSSGSANGGAFNVTAGRSGTTGGTGGQVSIVAGAGGSTSGAGGNATLSAGDATVAGNGGTLTLNAGDSGSSSGTGGNINLNAGSSNGTTGSNGGSIYLTAGAGGAAKTGGTITLQGASGNATSSSGQITINTAAGGSTSGSSGQLVLTTGGTTSGATGAVTLASGNAGGNFTSGSVTIRTGDASGSTSTGDITLQAGTSSSSTTGNGHVYIRTNGGVQAAFFKSGKFHIGNGSTQTNYTIYLNGAATETGGLQYLFNTGDSTPSASGTTRVNRSFNITVDTATNAMVLATTSSTDNNAQGQSAYNPIQFRHSTLTSSGGSWGNSDSVRIEPYHATRNILGNNNGQTAALLINKTTHSMNGVLQANGGAELIGTTLISQSALANNLTTLGLGPLEVRGNSVISYGATATSRILSSGANVTALYLQNSNSGSTASDGSALQLETNGTTLSLWNYENGMIRFGVNNTQWMSLTNAGFLNPATHNTQDIGVSGSASWRNVYAVGGVLTTSDAELKQDIVDLDEAELKVAQKVKGLIKKYRVKADIATYGDGAKWRVGVIAQEVQAAFESEGLDANNYGLYMESPAWKLNDEFVAEGTEGAVKTIVRSINYAELVTFVIAAM